MCFDIVQTTALVADTAALLTDAFHANATATVNSMSLENQLSKNKKVKLSAARG